MTFPHAAAGGYVTSPLQSPYLTSPLTPMNPALMSLFPATSPDQTGPPVPFGSTAGPQGQSASGQMAANAAGAAAAAAAAEAATNRQVQMQAAVAALMPSLNQSAAVNHQHTFSQQQQQQQIQAQINKAKTDRVEVTI